MPNLEHLIAAVHTAAALCAEGVGEPSWVTDEELLDYQRQLAGASRLIDVAAAAVAAQVAHRSRRELGYAGLAQKLGARTPEALVQQVTGASLSTARRLVRVGTLVAQSAPEEPWLRPVLEGARTAVVSTEAVDAIRVGLGAPSGSVTADALADAARTLAGEAATATVDWLASRARQLRAQLDLEGVALREQELRDRRYLRLVPQLDGMTRVSGLLDPESAALIDSAIDVATSPRRGGPRFVDPARAAEAIALVDDPRTTDQIAVDALVDLVDSAVRADNTRIGARRPAVRVLVTQHDLDRRAGLGHLEGQDAPVTIATVERLACDGGLTPILFDDGGRALDLGRTQRLHSTAQRIAISARDGGCLVPQCQRPPSWCEVHHIQEFSRGGNTSVDDGVLLCRHHHMLVHNNRWRITRDRGRYQLIPPPDVDPQQAPIPLYSKSPALQRLVGMDRLATAERLAATG